MPLILWIIAYVFVGVLLASILNEASVKIEHRPIGFWASGFTILLWWVVIGMMVVILVRLIRGIERED